MSNRGPKTNISHEMRVIELQKHNIFYENGKVKKESDPVWVKISANLNKGLDPKEKPISVRNIQTYVAQNRNHVIQDIKKDSANTSNLRSHSEVNKSDFNVEERLLKIKNNALYKPIIRELCTYPFIVFHWSFEALDLVSNFKENVFIFGVAGSPCQPFIAPDKTVSENIFLFTFGINVLNEHISICEFSSEENSVSLVNRFFYECLRSGLKIPKKIDC
ncbi:hypothetical protein TSAR_008515 [Trichomalopsis sarcophagae]|uniref:Uncharacterized protein n=1 Tax=Trichomalopsis sarcophagae TaxID=543379 RepID=A0A232EPM0_9HYME|nr:hypothetical protein TSAR_008515 [Trichomalopsis sarcophagae]